MTILIVDDNEQNLYQLQVLLGANGHQVIAAANGAEALATARQSPPDLVISDILMPVMDGFAMCREWKNDERLRLIPFIFYTATYTDERDRDFALSLGAERFLVKPEEPEIFMRTICEVIQEVRHLPAPPACMPVEAPKEEEAGYLKQYNAVLIRKMEAKMQQLEQANRKLKDEIAGREQAEMRIRQLNRTYSVLSNINEIIVREKDLQTMLVAACKVAVEKGLFRMAWAGFLDSHSNRLNVAAKAGVTGDYLEKIDIVPGDELRGCGPTAEALRTGTYVVCNDIEHEPHMIHWRKAALGLGFRASAAFPLKVEDKIIGVFNLYSGTKDAFEPEELRLLDELAMDISFALEVGQREMQRRKAEEELRWRTAFFEAQVDCAMDGILVVDSQGRKILQNKRLNELWKIPPHIAADEDDSKQVQYVASRTNNPEQFAEKVAYLNSHPEEVSRDEIEFVDGTVIDRYSSPVRGKAGNYYGRIWTFRDITESKSAEAERAHLAAIVQSADDAIIGKNLQNIITSWNASAENIFGYPASEIVGQPASVLVPLDLRNEEIEILEKIRRGENLRLFETVRLCKDGKLINVSLTVSPIKNSIGQIVGASKIVRDITEHKKMEEQFLRAQRMESIGTLAGGIAHDLNNGLAPILMAVDVLKKQVTDDRGLKVLALVAASVEHCTGLVKQVLTFARGVEGRRVDVNPVHLLTDIQNIVFDTFPKDIEFVSDWSRGILTVMGDPTQLHQVFINLCVNARDAMPHGGTLKVTMENAVVDDFYAGMNPDSKPGSYVMVRVQDTGTGIPPEIRKRIFDPFFTTKEIGKGTGLGLSTTLGIVKSHGGFINLYSEMGKGTVFEVYLPANMASKANGGTTKKPQLPRGNGELVLLVDDEERLRMMAQTTLEQFGYRVMSAANGAAALAIYAQHHEEIAIVLTDMAMPVMDGPSTILALRALNPRVKLIASSGVASGVSDTANSGVKYFVPKPYSVETMLNVLAEALREGA